MRLIPTKETLTVEFKSDRKKLNDSELLDEVVGFANTTGGTIYVGVEDDGEISGVQNEHNDPIGVAALIANKTVPSIYVQAQVLLEETTKGKLPVLEISVPQSKTIIASANGKIMRRRLKLDGSPEVIPMYPHEITTRLSELRLLDYSAQPLIDSTIDDFDNVEISRLKTLIADNPKSDKNLLELDDEEIEKSLRLIARNDEGIYCPTVTGMLLIGKKEKINSLIPTAKAEFQVLSGTTVNVNEEFSETIISTIQKFETFFDAWNPETEFQNGMYRTGIPEFDKAAFREALVNAFCHRDYTLLGAVRVLIDDEGLSITSPGSFVEGINSQNILIAEPHGRNPVLADVLKRIGLAEKTGRGIDRIFEGQIIYGRNWPDYSESTNRYVRVYLQRAKPDFSFYSMLKEAEKKDVGKLSINQLLILSLLKNNQKYTANELLNITGLPKSRFDFSIQQLLEHGLVVVEGKGAKTRFYLSMKMPVANHTAFSMGATKVLNPADDFIKISAFSQKNNGVISKEEISQVLGITPAQAYTLISQYISHGQMKLIQSGRYSKYKVISKSDSK